jgi:hypothetical protein
LCHWWLAHQCESGGIERKRCERSVLRKSSVQAVYFMPILVVWIIVALLCARTLVLSIVLPLVEAYPLHRPTIRFALTDLWVLVAQCGLASLLWFLQRDVRQLFSDSGQIWMQIGGTACICLGWLYGVRLLTYAKVESTDLRAIGLFILLLGYIYSLLAGLAAVYFLVKFPEYPLRSPDSS